MNKQAQDNMLSVIQKFLANAPPSCDVEISVKYNLGKNHGFSPQQMGTKVRMTTGNEPGRRSTQHQMSDKSTPLMVRRLRSEERVSLKDAIPVLTPAKKTESTKYESLAGALNMDKEEVNVSAESSLHKDKEERHHREEHHHRRPKAKGVHSSDPETDDIPTCELFPVKKALRYNKQSGKYDDISY